MIRTRNLTLTSSPVEATLQDSVDAPTSISIENTATTGFAYIGTSSVSSSNYGFKIYPAQTFVADLDPYEKLYVMGDSGVTVAILILDRP